MLNITKIVRNRTSTPPYGVALYTYYKVWNKIQKQVLIQVRDQSRVPVRNRAWLEITEHG